MPVDENVSVEKMPAGENTMFLAAQNYFGQIAQAADRLIYLYNFGKNA